jgi:KipI family sensor histidine kinase inhibitor
MSRPDGQTMTLRHPRPRIVPLGDAAVLVEFSETLDLAVNARIQQLAVAIRRRGMPWIRDVVPALGALVLHLDPTQFSPGSSARNAAAELIRDSLDGELPDPEKLARRVEVPVCYATEQAPDLAEIAAFCGLDIEEVIRIHCASPHRVLMVGFVPGHPYIGGLDPALSVPRRATPRVKVAAGSIAIANAQTVVYPFTTPGGWNIIGRTPLRVFDAAREPPAIFAPGDCVEFVPIGLEHFEELAGAAEGDRTR